MRIRDVFAYLLLAGALWLAFVGVPGCAAVAPPRPPNWQDRVDVTSAVFLVSEAGRCSAVAVAEHTLLTAAHCVPADISTISAVPSPGDRVLSVTNARVNELDDLAELTVDGAPLTVIARVATELPPEGAIVFAAGFGCYDTLAVYPGLYIGEAPLSFGLNQLALAMGICLGDSGGPIFDEDGHLIGILSAKASKSPVAFAGRLL